MEGIGYTAEFFWEWGILAYVFVPGAALAVAMLVRLVWKSKNAGGEQN